METKNTVQYKCPCCSGFITYDSKVGKMKCPYCDTEFEFETLKSYDESLKNDKSDDMNWISDDEKERFDGDGDGMCIYVCQSCGGEIIAEETTAAASCPFCGNPTIFKSQLSGELKPDYIIPFKLDKNTAKEALKKHLTGKKLLPKLFKSENHIDEIKGVYVPFWLFDTDADAEARYHATRTRFWSDKDYDYTETSHNSVLRSGSMSFDHIPVDGSKKMPDDLMESLEPFDFSEAVDFSMAYLSGYLADKYDVSSDECNERANERVKRSSDLVLQSTVQCYDSVVPENVSVQFSGGRKHYALYPVWILNTTWNGEKYTFAMNGQTGKFVGDLPVDKGLFWTYFGSVFAGASVAAYAVFWLLFH